MFSASEDVLKSIHLEAGKSVEILIESTNEVRPASKVSVIGRRHDYGGCRIGYQEDDKIDRLQEAADAARDAARGARGLTPEAETALVTALVQRVGREVNNGLARRARADVLRTGLLGVAVLSGAMTLAGAVCYGIGRAQGGDARVAELCQGSALKTEAKGGVSCLFWLTPPSRQ